LPVVALLAGSPELLGRCKDAIRVVQNTDRAQAFGLAAVRQPPAPPPARDPPALFFLSFCSDEGLLLPALPPLLLARVAAGLR
jgi:hypothetical protein